MPKSVSVTRKDLHPFVDPGSSAIEFRVIRKGSTVRVDVSRETLNQRFGVRDAPHGLLMAYEAHRDEIDDAVIRRAVDGGTGVVVVRPKDLCTEPSSDRPGAAGSNDSGRPQRVLPDKKESSNSER